MPDLGQKLTDERVDEINKRLLAAYTEAAKDLQKKAEEHTKKYQATEKRLLAEVQAGKKTQEYLDRWKSGQVFIGKQWQSKVDQMARSLVDTERQAVEIVNGGQLECFADNTNYIEYRIDKDNGFGVNFSLYDETTVKGLIEQEPELMRRRFVDGKACEAWNRKVISNCITQGILQGESIKKIADRIARDTASTDMKAMVRYARTAMTCAQNAGRLQAMHDSKKRGIYCKKVWLAVGDDRTREAHEELDGQTAEIDQPFDSILGEIMYPGDPAASDENVWNCRCALGYEYPDPPADWQEEEMSLEDEEEDFEEWVEERRAEQIAESEREPERVDLSSLSETEAFEAMFGDMDVPLRKVGNALFDWGGGEAYDIRMAQQLGYETEEAKLIERIIKESNYHYTGDLHRGIMADQKTYDMYRNMASEDYSGEVPVVNMLGTSSWSSNPAVAEEFSKKANEMGGLDFDDSERYAIVFHTEMPESDLAVDVDRFIGLGQDEVIVSREAEFMPTHIEETDDGTLHVYLEVVESGG